MTYEEFTTNDVVSAVEKSLPAPSNPFEKALYFLNLKWACDELSVLFAEEYNRLIPELMNEPSDEYEIEEVTKPVTRVDLEKLREVLPDVYRRIVFVKANNAEKILSRRTLYELCAEKLGEKVSDYETVNKGDLEKCLIAGESGKFIRIEYEPAGFAVRRKGDGE